MGGFISLHKTVKSKGNLLSVEDYLERSKLDEYINANPDMDWYSSLYVFGDEMKQFFDETGSIAQYSGEMYSDKLVFDFDCKSDIEKAREDVKKLLKKLDSIGVNAKTSCRVYFSGNKGFHVIVDTVTKFSPEELKIVCTNIAQGLETFDTVIYDRARKFRIANTRHQETKLYKIELTGKELYTSSIEEIQAKAKEKVSSDKITFPCEIDFIKEFYVEPEKPKLHIVEIGEGEEIDGIRGLNDIDFSKCPKDRPKCIHALLQGVMVPSRSERNDIFLHLGNYLRNQGFDKEGVYGHLKGLIRKNAALYPEAKPYTKERVWNEIIPRVFNGNHNTGGFGVDADHPIFKNYCTSIPHDRSCCLHEAIEKKPELVKIDEVFTSFTKFAENFDRNVVPTGINFIDDYMKICVGTTTLLVGAAGCGKTTLCLNIMENASTLDMHTIFFSLDMHKNLIYLKLAQKLTNYNQDQVLNIFKSQDKKKINEIKDKIKEKYSKTFFDFSGTLSMDDMKQRILDIEQKQGVDIKLVVVDYASRIAGPYSDSYANAKYNALRSKDVSDDTNAAWIILSQVSRNTGDGSSPLRTKRAAKDAGDWEEAAQNVVTVWRPFMGMDEQTSEEGLEFKDDIMKVFLAKNRMGRELESALYWNGAKGLIRDMTPQEASYYDEYGSNLEKEVFKAKRGFTK